MHQIYPITQESCQPYIGKCVCAILHDGTHVVGTLSGVNATGLQFSGAYPGVSILSTQPKKARKQLEKLKSSAKTSAYGYGGFGGGYGYGYESDWLEWTAIALLFALPFFFI